jgi:hypothetical protein
VAWHNTEPAAGPGAPRTYSDLAIECALAFKSVYHLSLRAAQGFLTSVVELMQLTLPIPDYSTVSRRQGAFQVRESLPPRSGSRHVVSDATGLRVYRAGEWRVWKHRVSRRRTWRKLHLGIDESSKEIVAVALTGSRGHDSQPLPALLEQIPDPIDQVMKPYLSAGPRQSLCLGARLNGTTPRARPGGVLSATGSSNKWPSTDARRGGY